MVIPARASPELGCASRQPVPGPSCRALTSPCTPAPLSFVRSFVRWSGWHSNSDLLVCSPHALTNAKPFVPSSSRRARMSLPAGVAVIGQRKGRGHVHFSQLAPWQLAESTLAGSGAFCQPEPPLPPPLDHLPNRPAAVCSSVVPSRDRSPLSLRFLSMLPMPAEHSLSVSQFKSLVLRPGRARPSGRSLVTPSAHCLL